MNMCGVSANPNAYKAALRAGHEIYRRFPQPRGCLDSWSLEDVLGEARVLYLLAVRKWDGRGTLAGWVGYYVRLQLGNRIRKSIRHRDRTHVTTCDPETMSGLFSTRGQSLSDRLRELSDGARDVAGIVSEYVGRSHNGRNQIVKNIKKRLRAVGWGWRKIEDVFAELTEAVA